MNKRCYICRETKPISEFYGDRSKADGYDTKCKACNKVVTKVRSDRAQERRTALLKELVGVRGCRLCGETDEVVLTFHHVDPGQKLGRVHEFVNGRKSERRLREEVAKCIVLCLNCHRRVHAGVAHI